MFSSSAERPVRTTLLLLWIPLTSQAASPSPPVTQSCPLLLWLYAVSLRGLIHSPLFTQPSSPLWGPPPCYSFSLYLSPLLHAIHTQYLTASPSALTKPKLLGIVHSHLRKEERGSIIPGILFFIVLIGMKQEAVPPNTAISLLFFFFGSLHTEGNSVIFCHCA